MSDVKLKELIDEQKSRVESYENVKKISENDPNVIDKITNFYKTHFSITDLNFIIEMNPNVENLINGENIGLNGIKQISDKISYDYNRYALVPPWSSVVLN